MITYNFTNTGSDSLYEYLYKCIKNDILQGKDGSIKTVKDMINMGWMQRVSNSTDELKSLIDLKSQTSERHKIQTAGRHRITN